MTVSEVAGAEIVRVAPRSVALGAEPVASLIKHRSSTLGSTQICWTSRYFRTDLEMRVSAKIPYSDTGAVFYKWHSTHLLVMAWPTHFKYGLRFILLIKTRGQWKLSVQVNKGSSMRNRPVTSSRIKLGQLISRKLQGHRGEPMGKLQIGL